MYVPEESHSGILPMNQSNKDRKPSAENEEGRPLTMEMDERISSVGPAGVMAMACRQRRPDATREAPAVIAVGINR